MARQHLQQNDGEQPQRVAVTGAAGFIGSTLVLSLLQMGFIVHVLVNRTDPGFTSVRGRIANVPGSLEDQQSLEACFAECGAVFHLAGIFTETTGATFDKTIIAGTANVVAAAAATGVKRLVYVSALGADEQAAEAFYRAKAGAERLIIDSALEHTIFRPSLVYGVDDRSINGLAALFRHAPMVPIIGEGDFRLQPVYVEELCALMVLAAGRGDAADQIYEIGGPEQLTYLEILDIIKRTLGSTKTPVRLPSPLLRGVGSILGAFSRSAPRAIQYLALMQHGSVCDATDVEKQFGVTFSSFELQLQKYLRT